MKFGVNIGKCLWIQIHKTSIPLKVDQSYTRPRILQHVQYSSFLYETETLISNINREVEDIQEKKGQTLRK